MNDDITNTLSFKLGKLMIALGWADGNLDPDEINALKNMLFHLRGLSSTDWGELEILMETIPSKPEQDQIIQDVINSIQTDQDKKYVLDNLRELIEADEKVTSEESNLFTQIQSSIQEKNTGFLGLLGSFSKALLKKSAHILQDNQKKEEQIQEYLHNKVLFDFKKRFPEKQKTFTERDLKKWSAGAGLLGRIAIVDGNFDENEQEALVSIMEKNWGLDPETSYLLGELVKKRLEDGKMDVHKSVQYDYLARIFFEETDYEERQQFIELLFHVANASQKTSFKEIEEIRDISIDLKVSHSDYIKAKLTISRKDRSGL